MTITNGNLAKDFFKADLDGAARHDEEQYTFVVEKLQEEFYKKSFHAVLYSIVDDIKVKHAECERSGVVDKHNDKAVKLSAVNLPTASGLSIRGDDGSNVLLAWSENEDGSQFHLIPWSDPVPDSALADVDRLLAEGVATVHHMNDVAMELGRYSELPSEEPHGIYDGVPFSIKQISEAIAEHGLKKVGGALGIGTYETVRRERSTFQHARTGLHCEIDTLVDLMGIFDLTDNDDGLDYSVEDHLKAVREGHLDDLYRSVCALAMERNVDVHFQKVKNLVEQASALGLSANLWLAYGDTDRHVYVQSYPHCDVHVHNNIDRNEGNVFVTVLNKASGDYGSIDVYLASAWYQTFEDYDGALDDGPIDRDTFFRFADYMSRDAIARISEDAFHTEMAAGRKPTLGKVLSYDIASKTADIFPLIQKTGYLTYFENMIEGDLEYLEKVRNGDIAELWGTEYQHRPEGATSIDEQKRVSLEERGSTSPAP